MTGRTGFFGIVFCNLKKGLLRDLPVPHVTYLVKDLYKEIVMGNTKTEGFIP